MLVPVHGYKNNFRGAAFHVVVGSSVVVVVGIGVTDGSEGAFGADRSKRKKKRRKEER